MNHSAAVEYAIEQTVKLCEIPSPSGMTRDAAEFVRRTFEDLGYSPTVSRKGNLCVCLGGEGNPVALAAHVDTLGGMVRSIQPNGRLRLTTIGGFSYNSIEGENCIIHTRKGKTYTGCVQLNQASFHVFRESGKVERSDKNVEVVIDEKVFTKDDVKELGIRAGDFVSFDPRTVVTDNGFVKSRHLDDKASVGILISLARLAKENRVKLARKVYVIITTYEEVGHGGASGYPEDIEEIIAVDMGAVGDDLLTNEFTVSICAKDSGGPYDYSLTTKLINLAEQNSLNFSVDIYPSYSSDVGVALKAGHDVRHGLIGPGVFASHGYERTHREGIGNTLDLLSAYVSDGS